MNDIVGLWVRMKNTDCILNVTRESADMYMGTYNRLKEGGLLEEVPLVVHTHKGERHVFYSGSIVEIRVVDYEKM